MWIQCFYFNLDRGLRRFDCVASNMISTATSHPPQTTPIPEKKTNIQPILIQKGKKLISEQNWSNICIMYDFSIKVDFAHNMSLHRSLFSHVNSQPTVIKLIHNFISYSTKKKKAFSFWSFLPCFPFGAKLLILKLGHWTKTKQQNLFKHKAPIFRAINHD